MSRPDLGKVRTDYQVADDTMIDYRPRAFGAFDIPFTDSVRMTRTEGALLDELTFHRGLVGLSEFRDTARLAGTEAISRFPNNPVPSNIPADRAGEWQGNDGHRDAFRHAYWNALMTQRYGESWTAAFATAHEGIPGNTANREAMDLYNNQIGRSIGAANPNASPQELANQVEQALNQGRLVTIDRNGNLEWSDRVARGQHGLAPNDVIGPNLRTPGVVSPDIVGLNTTDPARPETRMAAADPAVERMRQDPMYGQVVNAMAAKGLQDDTMAANVYAAATRANLAGVTNIEIGNRIEGANGQPDRTLFVFDGRNGVEGPVHARLSENDARTTPVQVAANVADTSRTQQPAAPEQETRRTMAV